MFDVSNWEIDHSNDETVHQIKDGAWVKIHAVIRDTVSGETRVYPTTTPVYFKEDDDQPNVFWWEEGNAACDCNRGLFFFYAAGNHDMEAAEAAGYGKCGDLDTNRFLVNLRNAKTGVVFYREFED